MGSLEKERTSWFLVNNAQTQGVMDAPCGSPASCLSVVLHLAAPLAGQKHSPASPPQAFPAAILEGGAGEPGTWNHGTSRRKAAGGSVSTKTRS